MRSKFFILIVLSFPACKHDCVNPVPPGAAIAITSPCNGSAVESHAIVAGRVLNPHAAVWVIVHPLQVSEHWVQPKVTVNSDGTWQVSANYGRDGDIDKGKPYETIAIINPRVELKEGDQLPEWPDAEAKSDVVRNTRR